MRNNIDRRAMEILYELTTTGCIKTCKIEIYYDQGAKDGRISMDAMKKFQEKHKNGVLFVTSQHRENGVSPSFSALTKYANQVKESMLHGKSMYFRFTVEEFGFNQISDITIRIAEQIADAEREIVLSSKSGRGNSSWHPIKITDDDALRHLYDLMNCGEMHTYGGGSVYLDFDKEGVNIGGSKRSSTEFSFKDDYEDGLDKLSEILADGKSAYFSIPSSKEPDVREKRRISLAIANATAMSKKLILSREAIEYDGDDEI